MELAPGRIGVVGDVHGCDGALEDLLVFLSGQSVEALWCVGDISDGPGDLDACATSLIAHEVVTVRGNHDRWLLEGVLRGDTDGHEGALLQPASRSFLARLPAMLEYESRAGLSIVLCHGLGSDDMNRITPEDYGYALEVNDQLHELQASGRPRLVLKGHTHCHAIWQLGSLTIVETGTLLGYADVCGVIVDLEADACVIPVRRDGDGFVLDPAVRIPVAERPVPND